MTDSRGEMTDSGFIAGLIFAAILLPLAALFTVGLGLFGHFAWWLLLLGWQAV